MHALGQKILESFRNQKIIESESEKDDYDDEKMSSGSK